LTRKTGPAIPRWESQGILAQLALSASGSSQRKEIKKVAHIQTVRNAERNRIQSGDLAIHNWYQFILGYPPHLVREYIERFDVTDDDVVFDPFCGTGTTPVEALKNGISCCGLEANPIAAFASKVKAYGDYDPEVLREYLGYIYCSMKASYQYHGILEPQEDLFAYKTKLDTITIKHAIDLPEQQKKVIPRGFISPRPLQKVLIIREIIRRIENKTARDFFLLALATFIVKEAGNVRFGPEVGRTKPKNDIESINTFTNIAEGMITDVQRTQLTGHAQIISGDARELDKYLPQNMRTRINAVITSPPYPNEKDYTRSTRLESVLLDFIRNKRDLRNIKEKLLRSNSRNIFASDTDEQYVSRFSRITSIAREVEQIRLDLNKTSGFEKHYKKIVLHYFGGMYRHFEVLKPFLAEDCKLAYVVGDQMSFFRVHIPTAELLAEIAESLGYAVKRIVLWRRRAATATRMQLDENVLILENK
jgi:DNA modification methylase